MKNLAVFILCVLLSTQIAISRDIISDLETNWNNTWSMSGSFIQVSSDGNEVDGKFYILKPSQFRFDYNGQDETVILNKNLLKIVDSDGYQKDSFLIGNHFLKKFLSDDLHFTKEFELISLIASDNFHEIFLKHKDKDQTNHIKIFFDKNTLDLKKWEIYDEFNNKTYLEFTKIKKNISISQNLFVVKYKNN